MKIEGNNFKYFVNNKEVLYKDLQTKLRLDMTVEIEGLNVYYKSPQKENKKIETVNRLIEEELERQEKNNPKNNGDFLGILIENWVNALTEELKPSGTIGIEEITKIMTEVKKETHPFTYNFDDIKLPKEGGVKTNKNKTQLSILFTQFPEALEAIAKCSEYGHLKYKSTDADYLNYQRVEEGSKAYADAGLRHRLYRKRTTDIESGLPHAYHVAWNALAELELLIKENLVVSK